MTKKGDLTKDTILKIAGTLFSEKGYSAVTMKDFCDRSELSRGGLYRHFSSTKEIFTAMLDQDKDHSSEELDGAISRQIPARQLWHVFYTNQKLEILRAGGRLSIAVYEFISTEKDQNEYLERRFFSGVNTLTKMIHYGQLTGEFRKCDAEKVARHIIFFLEGLKLSSAIVPVSESMIDEQFDILFQMVAANEG